MRRRVIIPCYHFFLFLPHDRNLIRYRINKLYPSAVTGGPVTACRCPLNRTFVLRLSRLNRFSNASPKPSSICACTSLSVSEPSEVRLLIASVCFRKKSSGDFPVVWCTHVLSSSTSFPYGKIVSHFGRFVNGEFLAAILVFCKQ